MYYNRTTKTAPSGGLTYQGWAYEVKKAIDSLLDSLPDGYMCTILSVGGFQTGTSMHNYTDGTSHNYTGKFMTWSSNRSKICGFSIVDMKDTLAACHYTNMSVDENNTSATSSMDASQYAASGVIYGINIAYFLHKVYEVS